MFWCKFASNMYFWSRHLYEKWCWECWVLKEEGWRMGRVDFLVTCCRMDSVLTQNITVSSTIRLCKQVWQMVRQVWPWNKISNSMFVWWRCNIPSIRFWAMWLKNVFPYLTEFQKCCELKLYGCKLTVCHVFEKFSSVSQYSFMFLF